MQIRTSIIDYAKVNHLNWADAQLPAHEERIGKSRPRDPPTHNVNILNEVRVGKPFSAVALEYFPN